MRCSYASRFMNGCRDGNLRINSGCNMVIGINSITNIVNGKKHVIQPYLHGFANTDRNSVFFMYIPAWSRYNAYKLTAASRKCDTVYIAQSGDTEYYMYNGFLFDSNCRMYLMPAVIKQQGAKDYAYTTNVLAVSDSVFKKVNTKIKGFINKAIYEVSSSNRGSCNVHIVESSKMMVYVPCGVGYNYGLFSVFKNSFINSRICDSMYNGHYYVDEIERTFNANAINNVNDVIRLHEEDRNELLCMENS